MNRAQFKPLDILQLSHRVLTVGDTAKTLFHIDEADQVLGGHLIKQLLTQGTIEHEVSFFFVLEHEWEVEDQEFLEVTYQLGGRHHRYVDGASLHH